MFMAMWNRMKSTSAQPEMLITSFLPTEELQRKELITIKLIIFVDVCVGFLSQRGETACRLRPVRGLPPPAFFFALAMQR